MTGIDLSSIFPRKRLPDLKSFVIVLLYFPIGSALTLFRICLLLNYICARLVIGQFITENHIAWRAIDTVFSALLGILVLKEAPKENQSRVLFCNKRSQTDNIILPHAACAYGEDQWRLSSFWRKVLRLKSLKEIVKIVRNENNQCISRFLLFPEKDPGSGQALLKFDEEYLNISPNVQLATIKCKRPLPVLLTTAESSSCQDLLWMFFSPLTIYTFTVSKEIFIQGPSETQTEFATRLGKKMAQFLGIECSEYSVSDKKHHLMNLKKMSISQHRTNLGDIPPRIIDMMRQVQEIVPHVPEDVIIKDLRVTDSVDLTVTNILEGIVKFDPIPEQTEAKVKAHCSKSKTIVQSMSFQERKALLYQQARKRYIEKHSSRT